MNIQLTPLFKRGDDLEHVSMVPHGPVFLEIPGSGEPIAIAGEGLIVGSLEYLLSAEKKRIHGLYVANKNPIHNFSSDDLDEMLLDYDFGFGANKFLSQLLEATNKVILSLSKQITKEIKKYKVRATHFAHLVDDLREISFVSGLEFIKPIVQEESNTQMYRDGSLFAREHKVRSIYTTSEPLTEFIESHKKDASICQEGNLADSMYVLLEGRVSVTKEGRYIASITEKGEAFGELSLFLGTNRTASLTAEVDTKLYVIRQSNLVRFHRRYGDMFANIAATLANRVKDNIQRASYFTEILKEGPRVEQASQIKLASFHEQLIKIAVSSHNELLRGLLVKYSVIQ
jgi:CRP-like cAMP-binding protein